MGSSFVNETVGTLAELDTMLVHASDWARFDFFLACFVFFGSGLHLSILISCHWFVVNTSVPDTTRSN